MISAAISEILAASDFQCPPRGVPTGRQQSAEGVARQPHGTA
jgi:hypothetical protein